MRGSSRLLAEGKGVDLSVVRGRVIRSDPDDWVIAGEPASGVRASEIADRAKSPV